MEKSRSQAVNTS